MKLLRDDTRFQREWNRNFLTIFLPAFLLFGAGGMTSLKPVALAGAAVAAVAMFRGWRLVVKYRRCTSCWYVNYTRVNSNDICIHCGIDLPLDGLD